MAIDKLQERIRKFKTPLAVDLALSTDDIPNCIMESVSSFIEGYTYYCKELLSGLKQLVPAVRFDFNFFSVRGADGMRALEELSKYAKEQGYYIFLDGVQSLSRQSAEIAANAFFEPNIAWTFDALILSSYIGSDGICPYIPFLKETGRDLFVVARTSNKSAAELQDLLGGGRLVHIANADIVNRYADGFIGRFGYSQIAIVAAASSADSLRTLRAKYKSLFMLLDGYDYPNSNAKNCSFAFDKLGYGAIACAGSSVTAAWKENHTSATEYVADAVLAVERAKKNLLRYLTIL